MRMSGCRGVRLLTGIGWTVCDRRCVRSDDCEAAHGSGTARVPGFHGDLARLMAQLRSRDFRVAIRSRWSATPWNGPGLGPSPASGTPLARGSVVNLVHVFQPLGSPGVANGSHTVPQVVGLPLGVAIRRLDHNYVVWLVDAPPFSARVPPPNVYDAYCVVSQSLSPGTAVSYPDEIVTVRLRVTPRPLF